MFRVGVWRVRLGFVCNANHFYVPHIKAMNFLIMISGRCLDSFYRSVYFKDIVDSQSPLRRPIIDFAINHCKNMVLGEGKICSFGAGFSDCDGSVFTSVGLKVVLP